MLFHTSADASPDSIPHWAIQITAIISVILVTILCVATPSLGTHAAVVFTAIKVGALVSFLVLPCGFIDRRTPMVSGPCLHPRDNTDRERRGFHVTNKLVVRKLEHQPDFVCACLLFRALGVRRLGPSKLCGRRDEEPTEESPQGHSPQHVHRYGR